MKKSFVFYLVAWLIAVAVVNILCFVVPSIAQYDINNNPLFWVGYGFIIACFIVQLFISIFVFSAKHKEALFMRLSLQTISYSALCASFVFGGIIMAVPIIPKWLAILECVILTGYYSIAYLKGIVAVSYATSVESKVASKTSLIIQLRTEAEALLAYAKTDEEKGCVDRVYKGFKYSDPMSSDKLFYIEKELSDAMIVFVDKVKNHESGVLEQAEKVLLLLKDRNIRCKELK